jgi:hypothetical protein
MVEYPYEVGAKVCERIGGALHWCGPGRGPEISDEAG